MTLGKYTVLFSKEFKNQMFNLADYHQLKNYNNLNIEDLYSKIEDIKLILEIFPKIYPITKVKNNLVRKIVIGKYIILYQINYNQKEILFLHIYYYGKNYLNL